PRTDGTEKRFQPVATMGEYLAWFAPGKNRIAVGEASPMYIFFGQAAYRIRKQLPDIKLIAIIRNPADRAFSAYIHFVRDGLETLSFRAALEEEPKRIQAGKSVGYYYRTMGYYFKQLKVYYNVFDKDQIKVYLYDDFEKDPTAVIKSVYRFIGVDDQFVPD